MHYKNVHGIFQHLFWKLVQSPRNGLDMEEILVSVVHFLQNIMKVFNCITMRALHTSAIRWPLRQTRLLTLMDSRRQDYDTWSQTSTLMMLECMNAGQIMQGKASKSMLSKVSNLTLCSLISYLKTLKSLINFGHIDRHPCLEKMDLCFTIV